MTIREALRAAGDRLRAAGVPNAGYDAAQMLAAVLGEDAMMMRLRADRALDEAQHAAYASMLDRRAAREPMQYILGTAGFMGLEFHVEPGVLVPRPDTEILCGEALARIRPGMRVLDIGTGSGALAVSIAHHAPGCRVTAVDVSDKALAIAAGNARACGADVRFVNSDLFSALGDEAFDMIVSNPPYISRAEMAELMEEVRREPALALFGGEDGLDFYRRICWEAPAHLAEGGCLLLEIGWQQREAVSRLVRETVGEPFALKDYGGNWRVVGAVKETKDAR